MKKQNKISFITAFLLNICYQFKRKIVGIFKYKRKKYYGKCVLDKESGNNFIFNTIQNNNHFYFARLGDAELRLLLYEEARRKRIIKKIPQKIKNIVHSNAGMFSIDDEGIKTFYDSFVNSLPNLTGLCVWYNFMEDYFYKKYAAQATLMDLDSLEAFLYDVPWTFALEGKKVLVVSPFAETIQKQYMEKREKIFTNQKTLPLFDLKVFKAENTIKGEKCKFSTWEETLNHMYNECMKIDFDVAILGCGSYGLPLANMFYQAGKSSIHSGGVTQIYFGVRGKRWDSREYMARFFNKYWTRPSESEKPLNSEKVENGCYW